MLSFRVADGAIPTPTLTTCAPILFEEIIHGLWGAAGERREWAWVAEIVHRGHADCIFREVIQAADDAARGGAGIRAAALKLRVRERAWLQVLSVAIAARGIASRAP